MYAIKVLYTPINAPPTPNNININVNIGDVFNLESKNFPINVHPNMHINTIAQVELLVKAY